jgi:spore coat polysaccharide biosynthesis predicted glycosyltransferase SpsG
VVKTAVYIDDDVRLNYPRGFVLNGAILAGQVPYPERKEVNYLLGAKYAPLRKEFWDVPSKPISDNIETAMITFGGADIHNVTPKVLKLLTDACPEVLKKVIIGKSFQNIAGIERLKDSSTELIYYPNAAEMRKVMLESDIAISAGGQTLFELARIGVPTIGICMAENQLQNIEGWRKSGFLKYVGWYSDENLEQRLKSSLRYLANKRIRIHISEIGRKVIDGQGHKRIVNAINTK